MRYRQGSQVRGGAGGGAVRRSGARGRGGGGGGRKAFFEQALAAGQRAAPPSKGEVEGRCLAEVEGVHDFMQKWFAGSIPRDDASFRRFSGVTHSDYHIVTAMGEVKDLAALTALLDVSHGCMSQSSDFSISIRNLALRATTPGAPPGYLVTYEEWQRVEGSDTGRICSVLFGDTADPSCPNGLVWMHSHETNLPASDT